MNTYREARKCLSEKVINPVVKNSAKTVVRESRKYLFKEIRSSVWDNAITYSAGKLLNGVSRAYY